MKPKDKILTYEQARELRWFCKNVTGTRMDFYEVMDKANGFDARLARLEKTCETIESYFKEHKLDEYMPFNAGLDPTAKSKEES